MLPLIASGSQRLTLAALRSPRSRAWPAHPRHRHRGRSSRAPAPRGPRIAGDPCPRVSTRCKGRFRVWRQRQGLEVPDVRQHLLAVGDRRVHDVGTTSVLDSFQLLDPAHERGREVRTGFGFQVVGNDVADQLVPQVSRHFLMRCSKLVRRHHAEESSVDTVSFPSQFVRHVAVLRQAPRPRATAARAPCSQGCAASLHGQSVSVGNPH